MIDNWTEEGDPELKALNAQLDALARPTTRGASDAEVEAFVHQVREEMVEEKLAEARAASVGAELNERAAHTSPIPEFDLRFAVTSVPTE